MSNDMDKRQAKMRACRKSVQHIANAVSRGSIRTVEELEEEFETITNIIDEMRPELIKKLHKVNECQHTDHFPATYTFERRVLGYVYVYKRVCRSCMKPESVTCSEPSGAPDWAKDATQVYYNNGI